MTVVATPLHGCNDYAPLPKYTVNLHPFSRSLAVQLKSR